MKNHVKTEATFKVDEANKVVICIMKCDMQIMDSKFWSAIPIDLWKNKLPKVDVYGCFTVTAKARCNAEDAFDVVTGRRIAESRAKAKAFKTAQKVYGHITDYMMSIYKEAGNLKRACNIAYDVEVKHIEELTK